MESMYRTGGKSSREETVRKVQWSIYRRRILVISSSYHVVRKASTHGHAFLLIYQKRILFHFYVFLKSLFVSQEVCESLISFRQLILQQFDALGYFCNLFQQFVVGLIIAGFDFWSPSSLFKPRLGNSKRGILCRNISFQTLNVTFLFSYFLKFVHMF